MGAEVAEACITWRKGWSNDGVSNVRISFSYQHDILLILEGREGTFTARQIPPQPSKPSHKGIVLHALAFLAS